jgi:hypothetical protein
MWSWVSFEQDKTPFEYIHLVKKYTVILGGWQIFVTSLYSEGAGGQECKYIRSQDWCSDVKPPWPAIE